MTVKKISKSHLKHLLGTMKQFSKWFSFEINSKCFLNSYHIASTVPGARDAMVNKTSHALIRLAVH